MPGPCARNFFGEAESVAGARQIHQGQVGGGLARFLLKPRENAACESLGPGLEGRLQVVEFRLLVRTLATFQPATGNQQPCSQRVRKSSIQSPEAFAISRNA